VDEVFIIMQIGDEQLERVCDEAICTAISDAGFSARRVDRHNAGDLLKSEIVQFIERSRLIVADLTNERPNCYLEVGYAMGLGKKTNLILTAREDHHHSSLNFRREGPRVHFDLEGYDILFWDPENLPAFREALARRLGRRARILTDTGPSADYLLATGAADWVPPLRARGEAGLGGLELAGYQELAAWIDPAPDVSQRELLEAMRDASVHTFGWPIGIVLDNRDEFRPRPTTDGIEAEVPIEGLKGLDRKSYDFWKLFRDGRFYTLMSLFEDSRTENAIFWDTRLVRTTEALLLLDRLYRRLGAADTDRLEVRMRHGGLAGRELRVANSLRMTHAGRTCRENVVETSLTVSLNEIETDLAGCAKGLVEPLFVVFDYFSLSDEILADIVEAFANGEVK
jgi:hypothetical protein